MNLLFITSAFPFHPGEQFIENEISYIAESRFREVRVIPQSAKGEPRACPKRLVIDKRLAEHSDTRIFYIFRALIDVVFWREIAWMIGEGEFSFRRLMIALRSTAAVLRIYGILRQKIVRNDERNVIYAYWNDHAAYAACLAKRSGLAGRVFSRAHGFDVYENRRSSNYMPLKRQFSREFDKVFVLSNEANSYFLRNYGFPSNLLEVSPLGVMLPESICPCTPKENVHLISVSFCVPIKRIEKIICSLSEFGRKNPRIMIKWTHIGDGPEMESLLADAKSIFDVCDQISFEFKGHLENKEVTDFYQNNSVDFFINVSDSEGMPVSIMEAMAAGVPALAPNIGGISELIDDECGLLMNEAPAVEEIVNSMELIIEKSKKIEFRESARRKIGEFFNAESNYSNFVKKIEEISGV